MEMKNLKIGTQLKAGLGIILACVAILGIMAWLNSDLLWQETRGLYNHPFQVRKAIGELRADILAIHRDMKDLCLHEDDYEHQNILHVIDAREADAYRQFEVLFDKYLGSRKDIDDAFEAFVQWKAIRDETINMLKSGNIAQAAKRTKSSGAGGSHVEKLLAHVNKISYRSATKAEKFYERAFEQSNFLKIRLAFIVGIILLLSMVLSYLLLKKIKDPLWELTETTKHFQEGNLNARSKHVSGNEVGQLAFAFNNMAEKVQNEIEIRKRTNSVSGVMLHEDDLRPFCQKLLDVLIENTKSQIGAIYLLTEEKTVFEHFESIGLGSAYRKDFSAIEYEGEFGIALATKQISHINRIPDGTQFIFSTTAGDLIPKEIITIPILSNKDVIAIISIASIHEYSSQAIQLVHGIWQVLCARLNGVLAFRKIREFSEKMEYQNRELEVQKKELLSQADELFEQNTELEMQKKQLDEASRMKSQFLSNMSHELRTPLNSIMALSRVLMMQAKEKISADEFKYLEIIERNGKNLLALINDILDLSKIEAGRMDINPRYFSLKTTIENILDSIIPLADEKNLGIIHDIPEDLPLLESDEVRVSQILQNLISNAVKFTEKGGVTVSVKKDLKNISVCIEDTGIGIASDDLPYIFDEFRQVDGSSSRRHEGTGLGLAIVHKATKMLGGRIIVTSVPGKGSVFTLILPVTWQGTASAWEPADIKQTPPIKSARKTILIIDDEPETAAMISRYLLQEGYNTITATSGEEGLKLAANRLPFAITLDVVMPDMDGWEVLQNLKKNPDTRSIPVIVVSISEEQETGFALGAVGYVSKPVSRKQLVSEIQKISRHLNRSVMIVDDNDVDRQGIKRIIEEEGMNSIVATDGASCLELIKKEIPDVLILDLMMPEIDGFEVLEKIRSNPETRDLPVIVVTAKDLTEKDRLKLSGRVSSVLEKSSVTSTFLLEEIKRILKNLEDAQEKDNPGKIIPFPKILIVEDNEAAIIQIKAVLESSGYIVDIARGGQEAIDYVSHTAPDAIILDLMMPEIDGFAVLEKIRGTKATLKIPVLILTAKDLTKEDFKRLSANNIQQLVQKGDVNRENLLLKINSMFLKSS